jgi:hypothetical protein
MAELSRNSFAQVVIDRVRTKFPLVKIARAPQPFSLRINGNIASLEDLYRIAQLRPTELSRHVDRWAVEMLRAAEGTPDQGGPFSQVRAKVLPVLLNGETEGRRIGHLCHQPLVSGLDIGYVIDGDRTLSYIPAEAPGRWGLDVDELHDIALENLIERSGQLAAHAAEDEDGEVSLILFQMLDGFDASRILLPSLHGRLRGHLGSPFVAAVPNRDILLCFRDDEETVERLRRQINADYRQMPHQITDRLVLVTADGLATYNGT